MKKAGNKPDWALNGGSDGKESACNAKDLASIPVLGRSPGGRERLPTPVFLPENPTERGAWWVTVHGVTEIRTQLSN